MYTIIRETFDERYKKYLENPEKAKGYMQERLKYMPIEQLAYLLAEHDKFSRLGCAEYAADDDPSYMIKSYTSENGVTTEKHIGQERLKDPLGREVDPWGRPVNNI